MQYTVSADLRTASGSAVARRLRRAGKVPGIVYGSGAPVMIELDRHILQLNLARESFYSTVINLDIGGTKQLALLRDVQLHPVSSNAMHVDFQAVAEDSAIAATVPVHYLDVENCPGVKLNHGIFSATITEVHVHCLPKDLPESFSIDAGNLEIGQVLHLSDLAPPPGVGLDALIRGEDPALATVHPPVVDESEPKPEQAEDVAEPEAVPE